MLRILEQLAYGEREDPCARGGLDGKRRRETWATQEAL